MLSCDEAEFQSMYLLCAVFTRTSNVMLLRESTQFVKLPRAKASFLRIKICCARELGQEQT